MLDDLWIVLRWLNVARSAVQRVQHRQVLLLNLLAGLLSACGLLEPSFSAPLMFPVICQILLRSDSESRVILAMAAGPLRAQPFLTSGPCQASSIEALSVVNKHVGREKVVKLNTA